MKNLLIKTVALSVVVMFAVSCKKDGPTGATGATGPAGGPIMTGNIEGVVFIYDAGGVKQTSSALLAGDSIILTNNNNGAVYKTTTNSTGFYTFTNVPSGTYSFTVTKPDYGINKAFGFEFVGGGTTYKNFNLSQIPTTNVIAVQTNTTIVSGSSPTVISVQISGTVTTTLENTNEIIFISSTASVSGALGSYVSYFLSASSAGISGFGTNIAASTFYGLGFTSGSTVYLATYVYGGTVGSNYTDPISGLNVYTALSSTPVIMSCIVP